MGLSFCGVDTIQYYWIAKLFFASFNRPSPYSFFYEMCEFSVVPSPLKMQFLLESSLHYALYESIQYKIFRFRA